MTSSEASPDSRGKTKTPSGQKPKTQIPPEVEEYLQIVEGGKPRSCPEQKALAKMLRRIFREEELTVDRDLADKYLGLSKYLPYQLFPWERFFLVLTLCTFTLDGLPRFRTAFSMIGRGAGKDGMIAYGSLCLVSPFNPVRSYDVDICANKEEQATRPLTDLIEILDEPKQAAKLKKHFYHTKEMVQGRVNRGIVRGRTSNARGNDGMRSGLVVFNEVHAYENNENIKVFVSGLGKTKHPRIWIFSSNGTVNDGPLDDYLARSRRILFDGENDRGFLPFICCLSKKDEVHDPENWYMANPSLQYLPDLFQETMDEYHDWKDNPAQNADFLTKRMGLRSGFSEVSVTDYENILKTKGPLPNLDGKPCVAGIDYAELSDWAAVNLHFRIGDQRYDINHAWICKESKTLSRVKAPWQDWVVDGWCTLVDAPSIGPSLIADYLRDAGRRYAIKGLAADHFRWTVLAEEMARLGFDARDKTKVKLVRPSDIMQADTVIQTLFDKGLLHWGDNPVLRWATNNTKRVPSSKKEGSNTGNYYYAKIEHKSRKTDPFMAFVASITIENKIGAGAQLVQPPPVFVL